MSPQLSRNVGDLSDSWGHDWPAEPESQVEPEAWAWPASDAQPREWQDWHGWYEGDTGGSSDDTRWAQQSWQESAASSAYDPIAAVQAGDDLLHAELAQTSANLQAWPVSPSRVESNPQFKNPAHGAKYDDMEELLKLVRPGIQIDPSHKLMQLMRRKSKNDIRYLSCVLCFWLAFLLL